MTMVEDNADVEVCESKISTFSSQPDHYLERPQAPPLLRVAAAVVRPEGVPGAGPGVPARPPHHPRQDARRGG